MASTYLTRTPTTTGNRRTFTVSTWLKKSNTGSQRNFFGTAGGNDNSGFKQVLVIMIIYLFKDILEIFQ